MRTALSTGDAAERLREVLQRFGFRVIHVGQPDYFGATVQATASDDQTFIAKLRWRSDGDVAVTFESTFDKPQFDRVVADLSKALSATGPTSAPAAASGPSPEPG